MKKLSPEDQLLQIVDGLAGLPDPYNRTFSLVRNARPLAQARNLRAEIQHQIARTISSQADIDDRLHQLKGIALRLRTSVDDEIASLDFEIHVIKRQLMDFEDGIERLELSHRAFAEVPLTAVRDEIEKLVREPSELLGRLDIDKADGRYTLKVPALYGAYIATQVHDWFDAYANNARRGRPPALWRENSGNPSYNMLHHEFWSEYVAHSGEVAEKAKERARHDHILKRRRKILEESVRTHRFTPAAYDPTFVWPSNGLVGWPSAGWMTAISFVKQLRTVAMQAVLPLTVLGGVIATAVSGAAGEGLAATLRSAAPIVLLIALPLGLGSWVRRQAGQREEAIQRLRAEARMLLIGAVEQVQREVWLTDAETMQAAIKHMKHQNAEQKKQQGALLGDLKGIKKTFEDATKKIDAIRWPD